MILGVLVPEDSSIPRSTVMESLSKDVSSSKPKSLPFIPKPFPPPALKDIPEAYITSQARNNILGYLTFD